MQDHKNYKEPTSLFEHFIIVGLHPDANLEVVEDAFAKRKRWELQVGKSELLDKQGKTISTLEPQVGCFTNHTCGMLISE